MDAMDVDAPAATATATDAATTTTSNSTTVIVPENSIDAILKTLNELSKAITTLDSRPVWRALRDLGSLRKNCISQATLSALVNVLYPDTSVFKKRLLKYINDQHKSELPNAEELRATYPAAFYQITPEKTIEVSAEINSFIHLLVQLYLLDNKKFESLGSFNETVVIPKTLALYNQRSLDMINAKLWFYCVIGEESLGRYCNVSMRSKMIKFLKTASLKHDNETKAMLINLILRNFLADGEVDQAFDFVNKVDFPTGHVSSSLEARYYFYLSKISAIQLDYSTANEYIIAAIRKAPHTTNSIGFLQQANKLHCVIQLLMGDIPELSFFHQKNMEHTLFPYYHLTNTVKLGDLKKFTSVITKFKPQLVRDGNYSLCVRLRSNVIKTGIRMISLTYKKIMLRDICLKLRLDSEQAAEYMVSRSIRDGVIEAKINHEKGYIETTGLLNVYDTRNPQISFDERIKFVSQLHDESVMAMRYPEDKKQKQKKGGVGQLDQDMFSSELLDGFSESDIDDMDYM